MFSVKTNVFDLTSLLINVKMRLRTYGIRKTKHQGLSPLKKKE